MTGARRGRRLRGHLARCSSRLIGALVWTKKAALAPGVRCRNVARCGKALATVGLLLHGLSSPKNKRNNAATVVVDYALAPFAMGGVALLQIGLATMLATRKFIDPRLWIILDSAAALLYVMYIGVSSTLPPKDRNTTMLSLAILAAVLHVTMIAQSVLTLHRLFWALQLASRPSSSASTASTDSLSVAWTSTGHRTPDSRPTTSTVSSASSFPSPRPGSPDVPTSASIVSKEEAGPSSRSREDEALDVDITTPSRELAVTMPGKPTRSGPIHTASESDRLGKEARTEDVKSMEPRKEGRTEDVKPVAPGKDTRTEDLGPVRSGRGATTEDMGSDTKLKRADLETPSADTTDESSLEEGTSSEPVPVARASATGTAEDPNLTRRYPEEDRVHGKNVSWNKP